MKKLAWIFFGVLVGCIGLIALAENTDAVNSPRPQWFQQGAYFGSTSPSGVVSSSTPLVVNGGAVVDGGTTINGSLTLPATTAAGAVSYFAGGQPEALFGVGSQTLSAALKLGGYALPGANNVSVNRAFSFQAMTGAVTAASGGGAANTVVTLTDGTNTCTFTMPCNSAPPAGSNAAGGVRIANVNGSGTGCSYPAAAVVTASVTTAGCTTTQPTGFFQFEGVWQ